MIGKTNINSDNTQMNNWQQQMSITWARKFKNKHKLSQITNLIDAQNKHQWLLKSYIRTDNKEKIIISKKMKHQKQIN